VSSRGVGTLTTATILFTDIVNSAAMRTRLGEESAEDHFRQLFSLQRSVTTAHGAVFIKSPLPSRSMQLLRVHKLSTRSTHPATPTQLRRCWCPWLSCPPPESAPPASR
jgi:hypothetical protein